MSQPKREPPNERACFERWLARYAGVSVAMIRQDRLSDGSYMDRANDLAWAAWCARARRS